MDKFNDAMKRLEEIVNQLEKNEIELEDAITLFEEGLLLAKECDFKLNNFETKINSLIDDYEKRDNNEL